MYCLHYSSIIVTFVTSTLTYNHTSSSVEEGFNVVAIGMTMDFDCIKVEVLASILVPTIEIVCSSLIVILRSIRLIVPLECALSFTRG